jgi:hypothetical protein
MNRASHRASLDVSVCLLSLFAGDVLGHGKQQSSTSNAFDSSHNEQLPRRVAGLGEWEVQQAASGGGHSLLVCAKREVQAWTEAEQILAVTGRYDPKIEI